ncbi:MAG TPA: hypothetical protein P5102_11285 [Candidatus Competibacteraceae bacterium]|nr:hypothetical protein [Candidatus Competibacteraceae bacterium]
MAAVSIGLLYGRLAVLYAPALPATQPETADKTSPTEKTARRREDAELFDQALNAGLLRPDSGGRIAVAPADLPVRQRWASDHPDLLAPQSDDEPDWLDGAWDDEVSRLHRALHFSASGRYVRQQIEDFNVRRPEFPHIQRRDGRLVWRDRL